MGWVGDYGERMPDRLRYPGDIRATYDREQMLGSDLHGRYLMIKEVNYDEVVDISTATLRAVLPAEFRERVAPLVEIQRERKRIRALFNS